VKTFPVKKRLNTELFLMGKRSFKYKSKGRIGSRNIGPLRRGKFIGGKIKSGSENNCSLFR